MQTRNGDRLHSAVMAWLVFTTLVMPPVVLTRSLFQPDYRWSNMGFSGVGTGGDLWFVILVSAFVAVMMWFGWRGARMPFHLLAALWTGIQAVLFTAGVIEHGQDMRLRGDTLGIDIWLGWLVPLFAGFALLTLAWAVADIRRGRRRPPPPWSRRNAVGMALAGGLWLVAVVLFRSGGELHGGGDVAAVLCMLAFWLVLNFVGLRPARAGPRTAEGQSPVNI